MSFFSLNRDYLTFFIIVWKNLLFFNLVPTLTLECWSLKNDEINFKERQNQLWDNLVIYAERNRTRAAAASTSTVQLDQNGNQTEQKEQEDEEKQEPKEKKEIEFHYAEGKLKNIFLIFKIKF